MNQIIETELERTRRFLPTIAKLLNRNAYRFFSIREATKKEDMQEGFDFMLTAEAAQIAVRIRRPNCRYRDLTIRAETKYGGKTEIDKIREGKGDMYFYAWTENQLTGERLSSYMIVDLSLFRSSGLAFTQKSKTSNGDGTGFFSYTKDELDAAGCLLIYEKIS